jgi:hypothetical protein
MEDNQQLLELVSYYQQQLASVQLELGQATVANKILTGRLQEAQQAAADAEAGRAAAVADAERAAAEAFTGARDAADEPADGETDGADAPAARS